MSDLRSLLRGSTIYGLIGVGTSIVAFVSVPLYTRSLTPSAYGVVSLVAAATSLLAVFAVLGLDSATARWYGSEGSSAADRRVTTATWTVAQVASSLALGIVLFASAGWLARSVFDDQSAANALRWGAATLPLSALSVVAINLARLQQRHWLAVGIGLGSPALGAAAGLLLVVRGNWGPSGVFAGQCVGWLAISCLSIGLMRDWLNPVHAQRARLRAMLKYSLWLIPAAAAAWVVNLLDRYVIRAIDGTHTVGIYQAAYVVASAAALMTSGFQLAWGPFAFRIADRPEAPHVYAKVMRSYLLVSGAVVVAVAAAAPAVVHVLFPRPYAAATGAVPGLALSFIFIGLTYIAAIGPSIAGSTRPVAVGTFIAAAVTVPLLVLLVPPFGVEGAAAATAVAYAAQPAWVFYRGQRLWPVPYDFTRSVVILLIVTAAAFALNEWRHGSLLWLSLAKAAIGAVLLGLVIRELRRDVRTVTTLSAPEAAELQSQ